ncbi:MAG TPA: diaminopimelate decarboxylase [Gaiellaceae bacterium]|nr:diaminopimelate decarboxylase [Gaiellaceae bacterium]
MLELFPDTAAVHGGELVLGGLRASELAAEHGTPLVVYCEETIRSQARAYRQAAPNALVVYGTKAFPNVALMRMLAEEGVGADVSTLGELRFAQAAGVPSDRIIVHGNNKSDEELRAAAEAETRLLVLDALEEIPRASAAGVERVLLRVTPGIEAETHESIRTAHRGSKFGLPPEQAREAVTAAREAGLDLRGLHVHIGSQLRDTGAARTTVDWLAAFAAQCRADLRWTPETIDLGGGLGISESLEERAPSVHDWVGALLEELDRAWSLHDLPHPELILEPGRSLIGRAGVTLYRVGVVKEASETTTYVAIDGGVSDNPRPQLYGARYVGLLANRADDAPTRAYRVAGRHCESGDVLIDRVELPEPHRGDLLAVPATGAYTLSMASNYNGVPRPAAVLVRDGEARTIKKRETVEDLLRWET